MTALKRLGHLGSESLELLSSGLRIMLKSPPIINGKVSLEHVLASSTRKALLYWSCAGPYTVSNTNLKSFDLSRRVNFT
jgi:hypothetical protein